VPLTHHGVLNGHWLKHAPQFALSVFVSVQNGASGAPSGWSWPPSVKHEICVERHADLHAPVVHFSRTPHGFPHEPQLALSVCVYAQ
jgi:hypothetical protein